MLTGRGSHDVDPEAMQAGAAYYLVKGHIKPEDLECSMRYKLHARSNGGPTGPQVSEECDRRMFLIG
jgi:hypothetical protein